MLHSTSLPPSVLTSNWMNTWGLVQRKSLMVPFTVTNFDWSNIANEWCASAEVAVSIAAMAMRAYFIRDPDFLWALNQLKAIPDRINRDADHDAGVSERTRIAGHRTAGRLDGRHRRRHVLYVQDHVCNRVLQVVGIAMSDHDRLAFVGLGGVDRGTEVHEYLRSSGHIDPIDLKHAERGLVELRQCRGVLRADAHRVQRHLRVRGAREQQQGAQGHYGSTNSPHRSLPWRASLTKERAAFQNSLIDRQNPDLWWNPIRQSPKVQPASKGGFPFKTRRGRPGLFCRCGPCPPPRENTQGDARAPWLSTARNGAPGALFTFHNARHHQYECAFYALAGITSFGFGRSGPRSASGSWRELARSRGCQSSHNYRVHSRDVQMS